MPLHLYNKSLNVRRNATGPFVLVGGRDPPESGEEEHGP